MRLGFGLGVDAFVVTALSGAEGPLPPVDLHTRVENPKSCGSCVQQPRQLVVTPKQVVHVHDDFGGVCWTNQHLRDRQALQLECQRPSSQALLEHPVRIANDAVDLDYAVVHPDVSFRERPVPVLHETRAHSLDDKGNSIAVVNVHPQPATVGPVDVHDVLPLLVSLRSSGLRQELVRRSLQNWDPPGHTAIHCGCRPPPH
mmetsp:Transcript_94873/g.283316  ORF Transcript_94873/g.283316 Transcript_94873/m.283316 type:complete len:201 (+) Transcript_94873:604-1206(+)